MRRLTPFCKKCLESSSLVVSEKNTMSMGTYAEHRPRWVRKTRAQHHNSRLTSKNKSPKSNFRIFYVGEKEKYFNTIFNHFLDNKVRDEGILGQSEVKEGRRTNQGKRARTCCVCFTHSVIEVFGKCVDQKYLSSRDRSVQEDGGVKVSEPEHGATQQCDHQRHNQNREQYHEPAEHEHARAVHQFQHVPATCTPRQHTGGSTASVKCHHANNYINWLYWFIYNPFC